MKYNLKRKRIKRFSILLAVILLFFSAMPGASKVKASEKDETIVLKISNWEEYIDKGDLGEEPTDIGLGITSSKNGLISDFEDWYYETYGKHVEVEYSTFGTNEDLYSQLILGDTFDLVCPSEYMIMKLIKEKMLQPLSADFFDKSNEYNYYAKGVSPYIEEVFNSHEINGEKWGAYAAGYMWGSIGIVYNPKKVSEEDAATWSILTNPKYARQVTIKDSARESYFPTLAILNKELLLSAAFKNDADYRSKLYTLMNDTSPETIKCAEALLQKIRKNAYSFETDSGKSDMITGKVVANFQWSGDAVYSMDQAEEDGLYLNYSVPKECTNSWFDGWVMLKSGIDGNVEKQQVAQAFINFISRPDNAIRNMNYIGYTSAIGGGDSDLIFDYVNYCYGAESEDADTIEYPLGYFFNGDNSDTKYILTAPKSQAKRQLFAQYPTKEVIDRSSVMGYFSEEANEQLNQMWVNVRCFNFDQVSKESWVKVCVVFLSVVLLIILFANRKRIFRKPKKRGYFREG